MQEYSFQYKQEYMFKGMQEYSFQYVQQQQNSLCARILYQKFARTLYQIYARNNSHSARFCQYARHQVLVYHDTSDIGKFIISAPILGFTTGPIKELNSSAQYSRPRQYRPRQASPCLPRKMEILQPWVRAVSINHFVKNDIVADFQIENSCNLTLIKNVKEISPCVQHTRVEWYSTFCDFRKRALCCRSGIFLWVQFQKIGEFGLARSWLMHGKFFTLIKSQGP